MTKLTSLSLALIVATTGNAFAHHPLGGAAPETVLHGFLSGVGHPIIGFDHLAFVLAIGVLSALQTHRLVLPFGFVIGTVIGSLLTLAAVTLPLTELTITVSVLFAGLIVMRGRDVAVLPATILGTLAGLFHGAAYGAAVIGAETTPIIAYLVGFGLTQLHYAGCRFCHAENLEGSVNSRITATTCRCFTCRCWGDLSCRTC